MLTFHCFFQRLSAWSAGGQISGPRQIAHALSEFLLFLCSRLHTLLLFLEHHPSQHILGVLECFLLQHCRKQQGVRLLCILGDWPDFDLHLIVDEVQDHAVVDRNFVAGLLLKNLLQ